MCTLVLACITLLALPLTSSGQQKNVVDDLVKGVNDTLNQVNEGVSGLLAPQAAPAPAPAPTAAPQVQQRQASPGAPGGYVPPLHGSGPHSQGTVAAIDLPGSTDRPLAGGTTGAQNEILVLGRTRAQQDGSTYSGHITIAGLLGEEVVGVDTNPQNPVENGPLEPIQQGLLDPLCNGTQNQICLTALQADSETTSNGSANKFAVATANIGGPTGINAGVSESIANMNTAGGCQTANGASNVANASVLGVITAGAVNSSSSSTACSNGSSNVDNASSVISLNDTGIGLPAAGCANGTPDTTGLVPALAPTVCNADDENAGQAGSPYGVREGLTAFVLDVLGDTALVKATTGAAESRAVAPAGDDGDGGGPGDDGDDGGNQGDGDGDGPGDGDDGDDRGDVRDSGLGDGGDDGSGGDAAQCADGIDNDGDGAVDFPDDPQCDSAADDSEADGSLAFTGSNLLMTFLIGALVLLAGLRLRAATGRLGGTAV